MKKAKTKEAKLKWEWSSLDGALYAWVGRLNTWLTVRQMANGEYEASVQLAAKDFTGVRPPYGVIDRIPTERTAKNKARKLAELVGSRRLFNEETTK